MLLLRGGTKPHLGFYICMIHFPSQLASPDHLITPSGPSCIVTSPSQTVCTIRDICPSHLPFSNGQSVTSSISGHHILKILLGSICVSSVSITS